MRALVLQQYYLGCLSHASYLIGDRSTGRAVVVDPQRDVAQYLADASALGLRIEQVIETHFHADFVSGHLELQRSTGATINYGPGAVAEYRIETLEHGQRVALGEVELEIRHTPGHTPESICIVVREHADDPVPYGVLTGDTLFIGDVGRPDLLAAKGMTAEELGRKLYASLRSELLTLPDETRVFPAHGAGSACGKNLSTETMSTIGEQRRTNYALAEMSESDFIARVTADQPAAPPYFAFDVGMNKSNRRALDESTPPPELSWAALGAILDADGMLIDTRDQADFAQGHLIGSVNVGLDGRFAEYCGDVVDPSTPIVLLTDAGRSLEARVRLGRIGFDRVMGAVEQWPTMFVEHPDQVVASSRLTASALHALDPATVQIVDVRNSGEISDGMIPGAISIPLAQLAQRVGELDLTRPIVVHCAGGYRSALAASFLSLRGGVDVSDLLGGFGAWTAAGLATATPA